MSAQVAAPQGLHSLSGPLSTHVQRILRWITPGKIEPPDVESVVSTRVCFFLFGYGESLRAWLCKDGNGIVKFKRNAIQKIFRFAAEEWALESIGSP
jgi:hypothetical protein